jgi:hypothetical protein
MLITNSLEDVVCSMIYRYRFVNRSAYMDFKKATDTLFEPVTHAELAKALGVSVPLVRQARLRRAATAHRSAPEGWERVVSQMAEEKAKRYHRLAQALHAGGSDRD